MVPRIDLNAINAFIDTVPYILDLQKDFYKAHLNARYKIMVYLAYERMMAQRQEQELIQRQDEMSFEEMQF